MFTTLISMIQEGTSVKEHWLLGELSFVESIKKRPVALLCLSLITVIAVMRRRTHLSTEKLKIIRNINPISLNEELKIIRSADPNSFLVKYYHENNSVCRRRHPNVYIAGFHKCGTYMLSLFLKYHPDIELVRRLQDTELRFYSTNYHNGLDWYIRQMPCNVSAKIALDRDADLSVSDGSARRLIENNKDAKLLFLLRDPVDRAISHYSMEKYILHMTLEPFEDLVLTKNGEINETSKYIHFSRYHVYLKTWYDYFGSAQIHVVDGDNFISHPVEELRKIESFLNIPTYYDLEKQFVYNKEKGFYCIWSKDCVSKAKGSKHIEVKGSVLEKLYRYFEQDSKELFQLIHKDLTWVQK